MEVHTISCLTNKLHDDVPNPPWVCGEKVRADFVGIRFMELGFQLQMHTLLMCILDFRRNRPPGYEGKKEGEKVLGCTTCP